MTEFLARGTRYVGLLCLSICWFSFFACLSCSLATFNLRAFVLFRKVVFVQKEIAGLSKMVHLMVEEGVPMQNDPMRIFLGHCGYWLVEEGDGADDELWSNGTEFVRLTIDENDMAQYAILEDRFAAELNLQDLLALLEFPVKKVA